MKNSNTKQSSNHTPTTKTTQETKIQDNKILLSPKADVLDQARLQPHIRAS